MYTPSHYAETRIDVLHALMRAHPLATVITSGRDGPVANHIPLELAPDAGPHGTLRGHVARANPIWREHEHGRPVLVVSVDAINSQPLVIAVVVGTDARNVPRDYPVNIRLPAEETGLPRDTVFLCFQIRSIDPSRFTDASGDVRPVGHLGPEQMRPVDEALRNVLGI